MTVRRPAKLSTSLSKLKKPWLRVIFKIPQYHKCKAQVAQQSSLLAYRNSLVLLVRPTPTNFTSRCSFTVMAEKLFFSSLSFFLRFFLSVSLATNRFIQENFTLSTVFEIHSLNTYWLNVHLWRTNYSAKSLKSQQVSKLMTLKSNLSCCLKNCF